MRAHTLAQTVDLAAERNPEQEAFRSLNRCLTYQQLSQQTNALAHLLRDHGVRRGDRVGVLTRRSLESAIAVHGSMKCGAAYVPLNPALPASRLSELLKFCQIRHLVSEPTLTKLVSEVVRLSPHLELIVGIPEPETSGQARTLSWLDCDQYPKERAPDLSMTEHDLAYIMFTSGSTGQPKGIMHTHHSGLAYAKLSAQTYSITAQDRLGSHSPLHFDMSTLGYFTCPLAGATTVLISEAHCKMPASLSSLIEKERLTLWYSVPFALIQLLLRGVLEQRDLSALRWVMFGGEPFPAKHLRALMDALPAARFSNVYGPAEVNQCTYHHLPSDWNGDNVPIGKVWENSEGLVVDQHGQSVATGESGELLVRSPTMMLGYWGREDLNQAAFFRRERFPGYEERFYRTGDLVERGDQDVLTFLGRIDRQVKIRGYRIELDEIENALNSHPLVVEAAAFTIPVGPAQLSLRAAVIVQENLEPHSLAAHLNETLPSYSLPDDILYLDSFPRTGSDKIDRRELQRLAGQR